MEWFQVLLLVHVLGAIIGFGPTFTFALLGPMAKDRPGPGGLALMEGMVKIEKTFVFPFGLALQPLTGVLLIFTRGWDEGFFSHEWLPGAIVLYALSLYLAVFVNTPAIDEMIELARAGGGPEMAALGKKTARVGQALSLMLLAIIFLMVVKPGS